MEKTKLLYSILLILAVMLEGCTNKSRSVANENETFLKSDTETLYSVKIDFDNASEISVNLESKDIMRVDEDTENFPGGIQQIAVKGDTLYMVDPAKNPGVYAYLKDGSQLFAYCDNGNGPEDIASPFSISVTDSEINVFDLAAKKLISLSKDGRFKHAMELSVNVTAAIKDPSGGVWIDFSNQEYGDGKLVWKKDEESDPVTVLKVPKHLKGMTTVSMMNMVQLANGELRYIPSIEPYIYALSNGEAVMMYELDFMGKWPSNDEIVSKRLFNNKCE